MTPHDRLSRSLGGVTAVTLTPSHADYELDLGGLRSSVEWLASSGIDAATSRGGTGECLSLTATEVSAVTQSIVTVSKGRGLAAGPFCPTGADLPEELGPLVRRFVQSCQHLAGQPPELPVTPSVRYGAQS